MEPFGFTQKEFAAREDLKPPMKSPRRGPLQMGEVRPSQQFFDSCDPWPPPKPTADSRLPRR